MAKTKKMEKVGNCDINFIKFLTKICDFPKKNWILIQSLLLYGIPVFLPVFFLYSILHIGNFQNKKTTNFFCVDVFTLKVGSNFCIFGL